jgi:hypothetical protein
MQDQNRAYCPTYEEGDLSRGAGEVAARQGAYHLVVEEVDGLQIFHYRVVEVACQAAKSP